MLGYYGWYLSITLSTDNVAVADYQLKILDNIKWKVLTPLTGVPWKHSNGQMPYMKIGGPEPRKTVVMFLFVLPLINTLILNSSKRSNVVTNVTPTTAATIIGARSEPFCPEARHSSNINDS